MVCLLSPLVVREMEGADTAAECLVHIVPLKTVSQEDTDFAVEAAGHQIAATSRHCHGL